MFRYRDYGDTTLGIELRMSSNEKGEEGKKKNSRTTTRMLMLRTALKKTRTRLHKCLCFAPH